MKTILTTLLAVAVATTGIQAKETTKMNTTKAFEDVAVEDVLSYKGNPYGLVYNTLLSATNREMSISTR